MNRAKESAKVHAIERTPGAPDSPCGSVGARMASPAGRAATPPGLTPAAAKPPRPSAKMAPASGSPVSAASARPPPAKAADSRRPKPGGAGRRSPSEPPGSGDAEAGGAVARGGAAAKPKARSVSVPRKQVGETPPEIDKKNVGKVPAYLQKRQAEAADAAERAARPHSPQPPLGFRKVGADEKESTLSVLKIRKDEVEKAQRSLPFKIETPGQKQREKDLESRLAHIDKLMGMFSKPTVFIPADTGNIAASVPPLSNGCSSPARGGACDPEPAAGGINAAQRGRAGDDMKQAMQRPSSREGASGGPRSASREGRAAAMAERRRQAGESAPWDNILAPEGLAPVKSIHTGVAINAPPGGKSSLNLGWD